MFSEAVPIAPVATQPHIATRLVAAGVILVAASPTHAAALDLVRRCTAQGRLRSRYLYQCVCSTLKTQAADKCYQLDKRSQITYLPLDAVDPSETVRVPGYSIALTPGSRPAGGPPRSVTTRDTVLPVRLRIWTLEPVHH